MPDSGILGATELSGEGGECDKRFVTSVVCQRKNGLRRRVGRVAVDPEFGFGHSVFGVFGFDLCFAHGMRGYHTVGRHRSHRRVGTGPAHVSESFPVKKRAAQVGFPRT